jgi:oligoribonuclease NrnB/cAMP/cGMP phosphodiesterase (DHH superfamily)
VTAALHLLTHTDLDGIGCAVLVSGSVEGPASIEPVENGAIDGRVRALVQDADPRAVRVLVTDHGVSEPTAELVDAFVAAGGGFTLLDHHRSSRHLDGRTWATVDERHSATALLFQHLGRPARFGAFARLVEDHDLWRHADPGSARLAGLLGLLGHERFVARFSADPSVEFREEEALLLEIEEGRRESYLRRKTDQAWVREIGGHAWAVCYADQYQSDLAERLMSVFEVAGTALLNPGKRTVSLRGRGVDVSAIAQRWGGGGHARAAAFTFSGSALELSLEAFEEAVSETLE